MENILNFITQYWKVIALVVVVVLEVVILILKRVNVKVDLPASTYSDLISMINDAEEIYGEGHGKEKLNYVVERFHKSIGLRGIPYTTDYVRSLVERILNTPTKKGGPGRENDE